MSLDDAQLGSSPRLAPDVIDPLLALEVRHRGGTVIVRVTGDLDVRTVFELRDLLAHIMSESSPRGAGVGPARTELCRLHRARIVPADPRARAAACGLRFVLENPTPFVSGLLEVSGLTDVLDIRWADAPDLEGHAPARDRSRADAVWDPVPGVAT